MTQLLDYADLRQRGVKYSKSQIRRLEIEGKFPQPVKLSAVRKAWRADEIDAWIEARVAARDQAAA
jgi:prophage regulatory protein